MSRLKAERSVVQGTYVTLESMQIENVPLRPSCTQEARKMDLEMAVLMQVLVQFHIVPLSYRHHYLLGTDEFERG